MNFNLLYSSPFKWMCDVVNKQRHFPNIHEAYHQYCPNQSKMFLLKRENKKKSSCCNRAYF